MSDFPLESTENPSGLIGMVQKLFFLPNMVDISEKENKR